MRRLEVSIEVLNAFPGFHNGDHILSHRTEFADFTPEPDFKIAL
jgi:hypothetical protein